MYRSINHIQKALRLAPIALISIFSCQSPVAKQEEQSRSNSTKPSEQQNNIDTSQAKPTDISNEKTVIYKDSIIQTYDSEFTRVNLKMTPITKKQFETYEQQNPEACVVDSSGHISGKGLRVNKTCDEVCSSFLTDLKNGIRMVLPSSYDAGVLGMDISPTCSQFLIFSSYDFDDYAQYYENRAELYAYKIQEGQGIQTILPYFRFDTKKYSLADVVWIDDRAIAFKTYEQNLNSDATAELKYKYYKANIPTASNGDTSPK